MMSETELMCHVTKQQIVEALVANKKQLKEVTAKNDNASLAKRFDGKPMYITEIRTKGAQRKCQVNSRRMRKT